MRQVKSQAIRTGVNQDWGVSAFHGSAAGKARLLYIHQFLKTVSAYPVNVEYSSVGGEAFVSALFYKYIQRARYRRSVLHRIRSGALCARSIDQKVRHSRGYALGFGRVATAQATLQKRLFGQGITLEIRNVYSVIGGPARLDLLQIQRYYVFNRYKNLLYLMDLIQRTQVAARFGARPLFADVFSKGLIRNRRKGQRRYLRLVQAVINHARETAQVQCRPDGWRMEIYGKLDGQLRAKRHLLTFGHVSYQKLSIPLNYTQRTIDTKFGAFGVKLWVRLPNVTLPVAGQFRTPALVSRKPCAKFFHRRGVRKAK
jgi:hypothetical protein